MARKDRTSTGYRRSYPAYRPNQQITSTGILLICVCAVTWLLGLWEDSGTSVLPSFVPMFLGYTIPILALGMVAMRFRRERTMQRWMFLFIASVLIEIISLGIHSPFLEANVPGVVKEGMNSFARVVQLGAAGMFVYEADRFSLRPWFLDSIGLTAGVSLLLWQIFYSVFKFTPTWFTAIHLVVAGACIAFGFHLGIALRISSAFGRLYGATICVTGLLEFAGALGLMNYASLPQPGDSLLVLSLLGAISGTQLGNPYFEIGSKRFKYWTLITTVALPVTVAGMVIFFDSWQSGGPVLVAGLAVSFLVAGRLAALLSKELIIQRIADTERTSLANYAFKDSLTGLRNRKALHDRLSDELKQKPLSVLYIDLDRFKVVNDTAGHAAGDEVLRLVAQRITKILGEENELFRVSGDEFVAILPGYPKETDAIAVGERIIAELAPPFFVHNKEWFLGASIGIAQYNGTEGMDAAALLRNADAAMVAAKENGRNTCYIFDQDLVDYISSQHDAEVRLRHALERGWIIPVYQPIVNLETGTIAGFETLARWRDADGSIRSAGAFIELAEKTKLVREVDLIVLNGACRFISQFNHGLPEEDQVWITVNVSPIDLATGEVTENIRRAIEETNIDPNWLVIELIESALQSDPELARNQLLEIHELGVKLAIDDFGTGYSSLAHLARFPVDLLKVDKAFIRELSDGVEDPDETMAAAVLTITKALKFPAIAEGVETHDVAKTLSGLGYGLAQGFLYSKPLYGLQAMGIRGQILDGKRCMSKGA
ncbi:putative bifunctional diguanylate cyclase/phosphodiesterase [Stomatohabitans albus]|uniref:putative bifunctional diguanylate cyclase/phosphodiesterase n=1 Tax=Stomatohabitans albus TaxID=3110766 RepID=UPI00300C72E8